MSHAKKAKYETVETFARIGASIEFLTKVAPVLIEKGKSPVPEVQGPRRSSKAA